MRSFRLRELLLLFVGDLLFLLVALWCTLFVRYFQVPSWELFRQHLIPFSILFVVWLLVFFIAGLYDQHTTIFRARLPDRILRVQIGNIVIAALFFFFIPIFGIAPKTNLLLYLGISFVLIVLWRVALVPRFLKRTRSEALLIAGGIEFKELLEEVNDNARYPFRFSDTLRIDHADGGSLSDQIFTKLKRPNLAYVVVDLHHRKLVDILPHLYKPIFSNVEFIDVRELYEEIFERLPLSVLDDPQFIEALTARPYNPWYAALKRAVDIAGGLLMGVVTIIVAPFLWFFMRLEGPGPLFIVQDRLGQGETRVRSYKFRSMRQNDASSASWIREGENAITRVGSVLRRVSLDEFPQFINILAGELSLIGPRNDIEGLGKRLAQAIPYYEFRYTVKPGITGWAQINQQYEQGNISPQSIEETKMRLAYDFYYIKNRTFMLDIIIALKTLKRMLFRVSSW
jgi:lipopolysaccharide/colanic/teichoic acid biosynthesis glycosyltransferase